MSGLLTNRIPLQAAEIKVDEGMAKLLKRMVMKKKKFPEGRGWNSHQSYTTSRKIQKKRERKKLVNAYSAQDLEGFLVNKVDDSPESEPVFCQDGDLERVEASDNFKTEDI